ncbi:MAG: YHYH protein [Myxococcota bacterium]|jgi:hypothetical protein|nr:YHYH protein [Myxococcota bacterium]
MEREPARRHGKPLWYNPAMLPIHTLRPLFSTSLPCLALLVGCAGTGGSGQVGTDPGDLCDTEGGSASLTIDDSDPDWLVVTSNGCPDHVIENAIGDNPNSALVLETMRWEFPLVPVLRNTDVDVNDRSLYALGPIGVVWSGASLFGPATGPTGGDAGSEEIDTFDYCGGHATPDGNYHNHVQPYCVEQGLEGYSSGHSAMVGFVADGFPMYGLWGEGGEAPDDLDECNGHSGDSGADGGYHYHWTGPEGPFPQDGNEAGGYPYTVGCFRGCVPDDTQGSSTMQEESYTECLANASDAPAGSYADDFTYVAPDYSYD